MNLLRNPIIAYLCIENPFNRWTIVSFNLNGNTKLGSYNFAMIQRNTKDADEILSQNANQFHT